jgi:uncharacterized repeat protein (TIGR01451 family)
MILILTFFTPTGSAGSSSLVVAFSVDPTVTYKDGTVEYTIIVSNLDIPGAQDAVYDLYFAPPKADGTPDIANKVTIATDVPIAVGEVHTFNSTTNPDDLVVTFNLNEDVTQAEARVLTDFIYDDGSSGSDEQPAICQIIHPDISIEKTVDFDGDGIYHDNESYYAGEIASWKIVVTNTGDAPVYDIYVTDDNGATYGPFTLQSEDSDTYTYDTYPTEDFINEACAVGEDELGGEVGPVCDTAAVYIIHQNIPPVSSFTYSPENPTNTTMIHFTDTSYDPDGYIISWWWDFGDQNYSSLQNPTHCYYQAGIYNVTLTVIDNNGSENTSQKTIVVSSNNPPYAPNIDGPSSGSPGTLYTYTFNSIDPEGDNIYYYIDWGDNSVQDWFGPFTSGEDVTQDHTYENSGTYIIYAKAKDIHGSESQWGSFIVKMPRDKVINRRILNLLNSHPNLFQI